MSVRMAVVAGQFYESSSRACREQVEAMLAQARAAEQKGELPARITAAVVPHAGWVFSGPLAAMVFAAVKQRQEVDTFVIFGAVHSVMARMGIVYDMGQWGTPLGKIDVDEELAEEILRHGDELLLADPESHSREHSIEVQVPFIQYLFEGAKILPIMVPPIPRADEIGRMVGQVVARSDKKIVGIASPDLPPYGPSYHYTPMGTGPKAIQWAKDKNDRFFIDLALSMQADKLVESAQMYNSACGAGAVAAAVAAAGVLGAKKGYLLAHTTSAEVMARQYHRQSEDSVGYAAIVYG